MERTVDRQGDTACDLIRRAGPGQLADVATHLVGFIWAARTEARRPTRATIGDERAHPLPATPVVESDASVTSDEDEADAALALAVLDSASLENVAIPPDRQRFFEQLCVIRCLARRVSAVMELQGR